VVRQLGVIGINQGRAREALPLAEVAQAHLERIANPPRLRYALLRKWAAVLDTAGKHRESLRRLREALTLVTDQPVEETSVLADIAGVLNTLGETQESLHGFRAALRRAEKLPEYDDLAALLLNLANAEATAGERVAAREHARQARALFVERDGERGRTVAYCDNTLGMLYLEAGELDAARAHLTTGREIAVEVGDAMIAAAIARALSDVMVRQGDRDDAERLLARALVDAEADLGPEHVTVAGLHTEVAALAIDAGRESEARKHLDAATRVCTAPTVAARNCLARLRDLRERLDAFSRLRHRFRSMSGSR
jgi:tetratricopeptide (TPR) repeat protein